VVGNRVMSEIRPAIIAAFVAGLIPAGWFALYQATASHPLFADHAGILEFSLLVYCYSVAIAFLCGYVTLRLLVNLAVIRWWTVCLAGIGWGGLLLYVLGNSSIQIAPLLVWLAIGGLCGVTFWGVWRRATPAGVSGSRH
jgi:hypothetical protein